MCSKIHTPQCLKCHSFKEDKQTAAALLWRLWSSCKPRGCKAAVEHLFWLLEKQIRLLIYSVSQLLPHVTSIVYLPAEGNHKIRIKTRLCIPALKAMHSITPTQKFSRGEWGGFVLHSHTSKSKEWENNMSYLLVNFCFCVPFPPVGRGRETETEREREIC